MGCASGASRDDARVFVGVDDGGRGRRASLLHTKLRGGNCDANDDDDSCVRVLLPDERRLASSNDDRHKMIRHDLAQP